MNGIRIKKIKAFGPDVETSEIDFSDGLNIIQGPSDTGKSIILECIDFCFGAEKNPKILKFGYDSVTGDFESDAGTFSITRKVNKSKSNKTKATVISQIPGFESGDYKLTGDEENRSLSDLLLRAIGVEEKPKILKNGLYESQNLTWRMVSQFCVFKVKRVARETSILLPETPQANTSQLSTLVLLTTGKDLARDHDPLESESAKKVKKDAVKYFVKVQIQEASSRVTDIENQLKKYNVESIDAEINSLLTELQHIESEMEPLLIQIKDLNIEIDSLEQNYSELNVLFERFDNLETQLSSDIKRAIFVINGEHAEKGIPKNHICPFCQNEINDEKAQEYSKSSAKQISILTAKLNGLKSSKQDVLLEIEQLNKKRIELFDKRSKIQQQIDSEYSPKATPLKDKIAELKKAQSLNTERRVLQQYSQQIVDNAEKIPTGKPTEEYKPREYFEDRFESRLSEIIKEILLQCQYPGLVAVNFNKDTLDIEINEEAKAENHGFGFCSFLNAVVAIGLQQYFSSFAAYNPGYLVIDNPLLGFDEGNYNSERKAIRKGLYQYLIDHQKNGQTIILENTNSIPNLEFSEEEANLLTFTGKVDSSRAGFLLSGYPWRNQGQ